MNIQFDRTAFGELLTLAKRNNVSIPTVVNILITHLLTTEQAMIMQPNYEGGYVSYTPDELIREALEG